MLFTPHLYSFKGTQGVDFEIESAGEREVFELYADVMFCAALNAWVLDGHGDVEDFPHRRGDFHEFMALDPKSYGKALNFALQALTGKTLRELVESGSNEKQNAITDEVEGETSKKKASTGWIGRLLRRFS